MLLLSSATFSILRLSHTCKLPFLLLSPRCLLSKIFLILSLNTLHSNPLKMNMICSKSDHFLELPFALTCLITIIHHHHHHHHHLLHPLHPLHPQHIHHLKLPFRTLSKGSWKSLFYLTKTIAVRCPSLLSR